MGGFGFPDICGFYDMLYGTAGVDLGGLTVLYFGDASGIVFSGNPPYTLTDFIGVYSKFVGPPSNFTDLTITANSAEVTGFTAENFQGVQVGQLIVNLNSVPKDTVILSVDTTNLAITMSNPASQSDSVLTIYETPFVPIVVAMSYIQLALACIMQARYQSSWFMAVTLFVAHYITLFLRTETGSANMTASQVASSGLTKGIIVHRAAGDVSASSKVIEGYEQWGAWGETQYGELFITMARAINCGPVWVR